MYCRSCDMYCTCTVGHVTDFISYIQGKIVLPTAACMKVTMEIKYVY